MGARLLSDYILVVLVWHGSQVATVCPLPVPGDLGIFTPLRQHPKCEEIMFSRKVGVLWGTCVGQCDGVGRLHHSRSMRAGEGGA